MSFTVAICLEDREYGGPEEGGWWYNCGFPSEDHLEHLKGFTAQQGGLAYLYATQLNTTICQHLNEGRPSIDQTNSRGRYVAVVFEGLPRAWPETRPHYE
jgi:hypothetical protein